MPAVTSYVDATTTVGVVGTRTNATGTHTSNTDATGEALRLAYAMYTQGAVTDDAFLVQAGSGMVPTVGSGTSKTDVFIVSGSVAGQMPYAVRLDQASVSVTVPAADPSLSRTDEVYVVVLDSAYDSNTLGTASAPLNLPRIGYRKGVAGSGAPGPDTLWKASALLATITVPANATSIVAGNIADARTYATVRPPAGTVAMFAGSSAPTGALIADGSAVSRTTYRRLFRTIGTAWGAGDGSTTFNVPNLKGKVPVGLDAAQTEFAALAQTGGEKTHALTVGEMASHDHGGATSTVGGHAHTLDIASAASGSGSALGGNSFGTNTTQATSSAGGHPHTITAQGGGGGHNNLQPYAVVTPIVWT